MRRLVLFDIDGTLIRDDGAAREAFADALKIVYGYDQSLKRYDFSGRTDPQITAMVLGDAGLAKDEITSRFDEFWEHYARGLERRVSASRVRVLAGVDALLARLHALDGITLALLTGNIERGARIKLTPHDLNRYFLFGAFGSDSADRTELPPIALQRARERVDSSFQASDVVLIGDSIYDVRCGVPHEVTTIAVASGVTPREKLEAENPDFMFDSLEDTESVVRVILGNAM